MRILFTIFFLSLTLFGKSECQYHLIEIKLQITTKDNSNITCYSNISLCDFNVDSINSKSYLLRILKLWNTNDSITVFKNIVNYEYIPIDGDTQEEKYIVSSPIDRIDLLEGDIDSVTVIGYREVSVFDFISTDLALADTTWLSTPPISKFEYGAYRCSHQIFLYENDEEINQILKHLNDLQKEININTDSIEQDAGSGYDDKIWIYIEQLKYLDKVVVVSSCTD